MSLVSFACGIVIGPVVANDDRTIDERLEAAVPPGWVFVDRDRALSEIDRPDGFIEIKRS